MKVASNRPALSSAPPAVGAPEQLLVVDDASAVRETLCTILASYDYDVTPAADGASAIRCATSKRFNLALLDVNLPDVVGVDLIAPLRELQPHLAVIMLSGEASTKTAIEAVNEGANAYLTKPWDEEKTLATIREALQKQRLGLENERLVRELQNELAERRRAEEVAQTQRAIANALAETAAVVNSSLDVNQVLDEILTRVGRVVPHDSANFMLIADGVARVIRSQTMAPSAPDDQALGLRFVVAETPTLRRMAETRLPVTIPVTNQSVVWRDQPVSRWVRSYVGVPIVVAGDVMGFLNLNSATPGFFTTEHARRLRAFAHQAAVAMRNASLYAKTKQLLKTTEAQARQMRDLFDNVSDGLVLLDQARRVVMVNPLGRDYLDFLCGESDGELDHLGPESLDGLLSDAPGAFPVHRIEVGEPKPRMFDVRVHRLAAYYAGEGWLLVLHDATEEHERQMYLQGQSQLATVGRLAAGIAHDFNNIMAVITLYGQIMMGEDLSAKNRERLNVILEQAKSASALIRQVLDFSRQSVLERGPLHLTSFLKELLKLAQRTLPESIRVEFVYGEHDYDILADPTRIQQTMLNLVVNARDAMPDGGSLVIRLEKLSDEDAPALPDMPRQEWIHISVADSGSGIAPDVLPHIFEPFFTTKAPGEGTGLGLAQVYGIVKQHDGFVDVTSQLGRGTTFHLYFPPLQVRKTDILELQMRTGPLAEGELVLIVEDNQYIRTALQETLEALNYRVITAADGVEALQLIDAHGDEVDVVLSDMIMPRMGGKQLYEELLQRDPGRRMVLFSGYTLDDESKALFEGGGITWLEKPLSRSAVANAIRAALSIGHPADLASRQSS